ncbi:hypothetical protein CRG98_046383, partial [Punica granatum]
EDLLPGQRPVLHLNQFIRLLLQLLCRVGVVDLFLEALVRPLLKCLNNFGNDISKCQFYMDMLSECRKNSGSMMGA